MYIYFKNVHIIFALYKRYALVKVDFVFALYAHQFSEIVINSQKLLVSFAFRSQTQWKLKTFN